MLYWTIYSTTLQYTTMVSEGAAARTLAAAGLLAAADYILYDIVLYYNIECVYIYIYIYILYIERER